MPKECTADRVHDITPQLSFNEACVRPFGDGLTEMALVFHLLAGPVFASPARPSIGWSCIHLHSSGGVLGGSDLVVS